MPPPLPFYLRAGTSAPLRPPEPLVVPCGAGAQISATRPIRSRARRRRAAFSRRPRFFRTVMRRPFRSYLAGSAIGAVKVSNGQILSAATIDAVFGPRVVRSRTSIITRTAFAISGAALGRRRVGGHGGGAGVQRGVRRQLQPLPGPRRRSDPPPGLFDSSGRYTDGLPGLRLRRVGRGERGQRGVVPRLARLSLADRVFARAPIRRRQPSSLRDAADDPPVADQRVPAAGAPPCSVRRAVQQPRQPVRD